MTLALEILGILLIGFALGVWFTTFNSIHYKLRRRRGEDLFPVEEVQEIIMKEGFTRTFASGVTRKMLANGVLFRRVKK